MLDCFIVCFIVCSIVCFGTSTFIVVVMIQFQVAEGLLSVAEPKDLKICVDGFITLTADRRNAETHKFG